MEFSEIWFCSPKMDKCCFQILKGLL
uniref:Uncharacterized protein n=1 Tax=Rhizophora mucronata TaxID=61149 RepID=A0A2P2M3H4_RHIMU